MTIDRRVEDAEFLWQSGRHEGGFLMALIAFAATARKIYPKTQVQSDREAFERVFQEQFKSGGSVRFRDSLIPMDRLFYKWLRCQLVHEAGLPAGLEINAEDVSGLFTITLTENLPISISATWYHSMIISVIGHPVNADVFPRQEQILRLALKQRRTAGQRILGVSAELFPEVIAEASESKLKTPQGEGIILSKEPSG